MTIADIPSGTALPTRRFTHRTALVTGGARGIGAAVCRVLAAEGARVAVNYHASESAAKELVEELRGQGGEAIAVRGDVSDAADVASIAEQTRQQFGEIDLLVNNAAIFEIGTHADLTTEQWLRTLAINLTGTFLVTWAVKDAMIARRFGRIVNLASIAALRPRARCIDYAVSKAGVVSFTKSCAEAFASYNIRVNAVAPGLVETDMIADVDSGLRQQIIADTPMQRIGRPEEMATIVAFLLSEESSFITGQTLVASGGRVHVP